MWASRPRMSEDSQYEKTHFYPGNTPGGDDFPSLVAQGEPRRHGRRRPASPLYVKNAFSSSGELNLLMWSDEFPDPVIPNFEKATGIKVNQTPFSQNEEQINKLQATGGEGFDLCQPTCNRAPQYKDLQVLAPFDTNKLKNMRQSAALDARKARQSLWTWEDGLYHLPHCWGSEALSLRTDLYEGRSRRTQLRLAVGRRREGPCPGPPHSFLLGIGLWWDGTGKLPSNRMLDGYKDEASFKKIWDPILPSRSSTSRGSSSSGIRPTTPSRA